MTRTSSPFLTCKGTSRVHRFHRCLGVGVSLGNEMKRAIGHLNLRRADTTPIRRLLKLVHPDGGDVPLVAGVPDRGVKGPSPSNASVEGERHPRGRIQVGDIKS